MILKRSSTHHHALMGPIHPDNAFDKRIEGWKCNECHQQVDKMKEKCKLSRWECIICCDFVLCDDCMEKDKCQTRTTTTNKQMEMTGWNNRFWLCLFYF